MTFEEFVNKKLWLLIQQPDGWREELDELKREWLEVE